MNDMTRTAMYQRILALQEALDTARAEREREARVTARRIERLEERAYRDRLTKLPNRRYLEERTDTREGYFILCDLDNFKAAQDAHPEGHAYGDRVLCEFADYLVSIIRTSQRIAVRMGGDEFVVWCPTWHGADRIKRLVRKWSSDDVTASSGMGRDMASADANLYANKQERKREAA